MPSIVDEVVDAAVDASCSVGSLHQLWQGGRDIELLDTSPCLLQRRELGKIAGSGDDFIPSGKYSKGEFKAETG